MRQPLKCAYSPQKADRYQDIIFDLLPFSLLSTFSLFDSLFDSVGRTSVCFVLHCTRVQSRGYVLFGMNCVHYFTGPGEGLTVEDGKAWVLAALLRGYGVCVRLDC